MPVCQRAATQMQLLELLEVLGLDVAAWLSLHPAALARIWDFGGERQRVARQEQVPKWVWSWCCVCLFIYLFKLSLPQ